MHIVISQKIILEALEKSLLILGAFFFYTLVKDYKQDILLYFPFAKKYYKTYILFFHLLFIFILDLILLYSFAYLFHIPL
jgi:hypothetical protein